MIKIDQFYNNVGNLLMFLSLDLLLYTCNYCKHYLTKFYFGFLCLNKVIIIILRALFSLGRRSPHVFVKLMSILCHFAYPLQRRVNYLSHLFLIGFPLLHFPVTITCIIVLSSSYWLQCSLHVRSMHCFSKPLQRGQNILFLDALKHEIAGSLIGKLFIR